jgi:hypothetical protein
VQEEKLDGIEPVILLKESLSSKREPHKFPNSKGIQPVI